MFKWHKSAGIVSAFVFALLFPAFIFSQTAPTALLVYADDPDAVEIIDAGGVGRMSSIGDEIKPGESVHTLLSAAEIKLTPNGSIVKLARNTNFKIDGLAKAPGESNDFALLKGKIRTVAAKTVGGEKYKIRTPSAVCGVRGTDFLMNVVEGARDSVMVKNGLVDFSRTLADGTMESVSVGAGQFADVFGAQFAAIAFTAQQFAEEFTDVEFEALNPADVPGSEEALAQENPVAVEKEVVEPTPEAVPKDMVVEPAEKLAAPKPDFSESKLMAWARDMLGFEIGSVVIDGNTYSKAVIQPSFALGKLKMSLYLPVIYTSDLFDPNTWYKPRDNNEWSFGSEYWDTDPIKGSMDALSDLALKIRFIEYGDQAVDKAYLKVGNLSTMTIGHGVIMRNFANDTDFPSVRRIGLNAGYDAGFFGAEGVVNDLVEPTIYGGRVKLLYLLGFSLIADINPTIDLESDDPLNPGQMMLLGTGLDLDLPIIRGNPLFSLRAYADVAAIVPYTFKDIGTGASKVAAGLQTQAIYDPNLGSGLDAFRNYGVASGFLGNILFIDYRLEYRLQRGAFRPTFFDAAYERNRGTYAKEFAAMLQSVTEQATTQGIYGEAGFSMFRDKLSLNAGYMMPWSSDSNLSMEDVFKGDYLQAKFELKKGLIPILDVGAAFSYQRTGFMYALLTDTNGVNLFDEQTVFKGEVTYPIASSVDFAIVATTATARNADGTVKYDSGTKKPLVEPTITFETRISF